MRYVQNALPGGDERGYSQALVGVDGDWRGIEVHALGDEQAVIENEYAREAATGSEAEAVVNSDRKRE